MRRIGLIGGVSWQSTLLYYTQLNQKIHARMGKNHSASLLIDSLDFEAFVKMKTASERQAAQELLSASCRRLYQAGAECLIVCSNTLHMFETIFTEHFEGTFLHLAQCTADAICASGLHTVALLGTRYTMQRRYYRSHLEAAGLNVLIPPAGEVDSIHRIITDELIHGNILPHSKQKVCSFIQTLQERGAEGVVLGCTELPLLIHPEDTQLPLFDTVDIHTEAAIEWSVGDLYVPEEQKQTKK